MAASSFGLTFGPSAARRIYQGAAGLFDDPAADTNRNGLISTTGLATCLNRRVPALTDGKQTPGMEACCATTSGR
jgi:hypothetical protein